MDKLAKFRYFPHGMKDAPRHPVFIGWRDERDL
jgi:DNA ligase-1